MSSTIPYNSIICGTIYNVPTMVMFIVIYS